MPNQTLTLVGEIEYPKLFLENRDMTGYKNAFVDHDGAYTMNLKMDDDNWNKLRATPTLKQGSRKDPSVLKLVRKHTHKIPAFGGPPKVLDPNGDQMSFEDDVIIGNGSKVEVDVTVWWPADKSTAITAFDEVRVIDLVEYIKPGDDTVEEVDDDEGYFRNDG